MENRNSIITKLSVKNGLLIGLITIVVSLCLHFIDPLMMYTSTWVAILSFVIVIVLLVVVGISTRKELGGYWTFGEAFKSFLIIALILAVLTTLYNIVLMTLIDPDLPARAGAVVEESQRQMMEKFGMSQDQIDEAMAKSGSMEDRLKITFKNVITSFGVGLAIYAVIGLILAAILKKKEPVFVNETED